MQSAQSASETRMPEHAHAAKAQLTPEQAARQRRLAILARARRVEIEALIADLGGPPPHETLKAPETGTVMVEGRAGGSGRRFNLGEATVTRCVVRLESGAMGHAYALGRDKTKARLSALLDALALEPGTAGPVEAAIARLGAAQAEARALASRKAAATRVEFFTMVRGEG